MLPTLPTEVIEIVIDAATYHTQTLRNFALTCHDLLLRSRYHLFRYLCFRDTIQLHSFYKFLDLHPGVGSFVISLKLTTTRGDPRSLLVLQTIPTLLFRKLPNLYIWHFNDPETYHRDPRRCLTFSSPTLACLRAHGTAIVELHLDSVSLPNCAHFVEYITAFRGLKHLYCGSLHFKTGLDDMRFHSLKQRLAGRLRLSTLVIGCDVPDDAALALLEASASTLLNLELRMHEETKLDVPSVVSELRELCSLTLALQLCEPDYEGTMRDSERIILRTLQTIEAISLRPKSRLQELVIHLREVNVTSFLRMVSKTDYYPGLERYNKLESILLRLPSLRNIEIRHDLPRDIDWTLTLEECLPRLAKQKMVTLTCLTPTCRRQASHDKQVCSVAVSPDSKRVASGSDDRTIILWNTWRPAVVYEWIAHSDAISSLAFSPDSRRLASAGRDRKLVIWDISGSGAKRVATLEGHSDEVNACVWSPVGSTLVSGSNDGTVRIWDARTYQQLHSLQDLSCEAVQFVRFSSDGRWIASGGESTSCAVWDAATGDLHVVLRGHSNKLYSSVFDLATGRIATTSHDNTARIWDAETGEVLVVLEGHTHGVLDVAFSPDGRYVVSGSIDRTVKVWDSFSGDLLLSLEAHTDDINVVCFSPNGEYIASASWDKTVRVWRASDGACIRTFTEHTNWIRCLVYSPDGETLTSGGNDGKVCIRRLHDVMP